MNAAIFLAGAVLTVLVVLRVVQLIYWRNSARAGEALLAGAGPGDRGSAGRVLLLNWIPPVPLSLSTAACI
ncbi:MAG: hypothetical protein U0361_13685 [Nitrospiraceae bacterium]